MPATELSQPGMMTLLRKVAFTGLGALQNRGELFLVELQEETNRAIELAIWAGAVFFLAAMFVVVLTATIILIFPNDQRVYAAGGFALLYLIGSLLCFLNLKALIKRMALPFADTLAEVKKDREWLDSLK